MKANAGNLPGDRGSNASPARRFSVSHGWLLLLSGLTVMAIGQYFFRERINRRATENVSHLSADFLVDLNSAGHAELEALPDVGAALASRIIDYRQTHGPFRGVEEILQVRGVGQRTLDQLRPMLMVVNSEPPTEEGRVAQRTKPAAPAR